MRFVTLGVLFSLLLVGSAPAQDRRASRASAFADSGAVVVYVTVTGTHYHRATCRHLRHTKRKALLHRLSEEQYAACRTCAPPRRDQAAPPEASSPAAALAASVRCRGITRSGARCRRRTLDARARCHLHRKSP